MEKSKKEKRIKKLSNIKVWPSVLAVLINLVIMFTAQWFFSVFVFSISIDNILSTNYKDIQNLTNEFNSIAAQKSGYETSIKKLNTKWKKVSSIQMYDKNDKRIAGDGPELLDEDIVFKMDLYSGSIVVIDKSLMDSSIKFHKKNKNNKDEKVKALENDEIIYEHPIWLQTKPIGKDKVYFRFCTEIILASRIFLFDLLISTVMFIITIIPLIFLCTNIAKNARANKKMKNVLFTDFETGGNNWICFEEKSKSILRRNKSKSFAIVDIELKGYTNYSTFHSTQECQDLIEKTYHFLNKKLLYPKVEMTAHISRSNYVMLLKCEQVRDINERIRQLINSVNNNDKLYFHAGVCIIPENQTRKQRTNLDIETLYNNASMAKRSLVGTIGSAVMQFNQKMLEEQIWEHKVINRIDEAIQNKEFKVFIQPKYSPVTEKLTGAEALIRWVNDEDGFIGPGKFIPIYEKNGLITKIDDYMLDNVAKLQAFWLSKGYKIVPVSVNLSRAHFSMGNLATHICNIVDKYKLPHKYIEIELTESAFFDDKDKLLNIVNDIKDAGFEVSMDDFGAGYSSLNSLKDLPLDVLKLDAEFFRGNTEQNRAQIVVSDAIALAKHLNMRVVAEGIEKKDQVDFLANIGCDMIQGFYYSKPVPVEEYMKKMEK